MEGLAAAVLSLFLIAQEQSPDPLQALELQEDAQRLFILGDSRQQSTGLYSEVRECLETTHREWKTKTLRQDLRQRLKHCLATDLRLSDLHFEFQRRRADNPAALDLIYKNTLSLLPEGRKSHYEMRRRNLLEIKYREHLVRFPIFSDALIFPGWSLDDRIAIQDLLVGDGGLPADVFEKALLLQELTREEFAQIFYILHPQAPKSELELSLARYYFFGRAFIHQWTEEEWASELEKANDLPIESKKWIEGWKKDLPFYATLLHLELESRPIDWDSPYFTSENKLNILLWVDMQFGALWPQFRTELPLKELAEEARKLHPDPRLPLLALEIERFISESGNWSAEEALQFRKAKAEVESESWLSLEDSQSSYRQLPDELRNLLAAIFFPQLSVKAARAILEDSFFRLSSPEQIGALQLAAASDTKDAKGEIFLERLTKTDPLKLEDRRKILRELVRIHRRWILAEDLPWIEWQADRVLLLDGKSVLKRSEVERDEMRQAIDDFGSQVQYGWYPEFLIDPLMIYLFPSENYWKHEGEKLFSELTRQDQLWSLRDRLEKLKAEGIDESAILHIEAQLKSLFVSENGISRMDGSSPGVWLASFWSGFRHDPARAIPGVLTGAAVTLVFKWAGVRWAFIFIAGDSVLRFQTAAAQNPRSLEWYEIDLDRGTSTFVGKTFAHMAQDLYQTGSMLWDPKDDFDHLEAWYRTGEMTYDFFAFSAGSAAMSRILSESSLGLRRTQSRRWEALHEAKTLGQKLSEKENLLRQKIRNLESQRAQMSDLNGKLSTKLENEIQRITDELTRINSSSGLKQLSLPAFWARQTGRMLWRAGETLFLARPFPKLREFRAENLIRYWQRDFQLTRLQVEELLLKADQKWRASLTDPVFKSRIVDRELLTKTERAAILENPGDSLSAIYRTLTKYEESLPGSKTAGKKLQALIDLLKKTLEQEELVVSGIQKLKIKTPGVLETWLARLENLRKGEFGGPKAELGIYNELQFSSRALDQASTLRLLDAGRAIDHLRALEARLRLRFNTAEFAASPAQISALKGMGEKLMPLQERLNAELSKRSAFVSIESTAMSWVDLLAQLKKDQWVSPQAVLEPSSLRQAFVHSKIASEVPAALKEMKGEWKVDYAAKPFEIYFRKTPAGNLEIFIGREMYGEWRLVSKFQSGPLSDTRFPIAN